MDFLGNPPSSLGPRRLWLCLTSTLQVLRLGLVSCPDAYTTPRGGLSVFWPFRAKAPRHHHPAVQNQLVVLGWW